MADDWLSNINPDDLAEIEATFHRVEIEHEGQSAIELHVLFPDTAAIEFIATLDDAVEGNMMAVFKLMTFVTAIGETLYAALNKEPDDDDS